MIDVSTISMSAARRGTATHAALVPSMSPVAWAREACFVARVSLPSMEVASGPLACAAAAPCRCASSSMEAEGPLVVDAGIDGRLSPLQLGIFGSTSMAIMRSVLGFLLGGAGRSSVVLGMMSITSRSWCIPRPCSCSQRFEDYLPVSVASSGRGGLWYCTWVTSVLAARCLAAARGLSSRLMVARSCRYIAPSRRFA